MFHTKVLKQIITAIEDFLDECQRVPDSPPEVPKQLWPIVNVMTLGHLYEIRDRLAFMDLLEAKRLVIELQQPAHRYAQPYVVSLYTKSGAVIITSYGTSYLEAYKAIPEQERKRALEHA